MSFLKENCSKQKFLLDDTRYRGTDKFAGMSLQLRIEQVGQGVMVINANNVLHLNHTATAFAYYFMQGLPEKDAVSKNSPHVPRKR